MTGRDFPLIVTAALKLSQQHFVIDGDAMVLSPDAVSDFDALHSDKRNKRAQLYAFDVLAGDGEDHCRLPLSLREANLARLLSRSKAMLPVVADVPCRRAGCPVVLKATHRGSCLSEQERPRAELT